MQDIFNSYILILIFTSGLSVGASTNNTKEIVLSHRFKHSDSFKLEDGEKVKLVQMADSDPEAAFRLYQHFMITKGDYPNGMLYLRKAAINGHEGAMYGLGCMLSDGKQSDDDIDEALLWYIKSFDAGYPASATRIGELYEKEGKYRNIDKAIFWFKKAAEAGHKPANRKLKELKKADLDQDE